MTSWKGFVLFTICTLAFLMVLTVPLNAQRMGPRSGATMVKQTAGNTRTVTFVNNCKVDVWWAVITSDKGKDCGSGFFAMPGNGGDKLAKQGGRQTITVNLEKGCGNNMVWSGNFYPRTGCDFKNTNVGLCETGGCGDQLHCKTGVGGAPPKGLAEFRFDQNGNDFYDLSFVDGFNLPIQIKPTAIIKKPRNDKYGCGVSACKFDFVQETSVKDETSCLNDLKVRNGRGTLVGCTSACQAFDAGHADRMANSKYCCTGSYFGPVNRNDAGNCPSTSYSDFFKKKCPDAYAWPQDDNNSTFSCVATAYEVTFCP